jgi:hypothetical protein
LCGWIKTEVYKRSVDTRGKSLDRILDADVRREKRESRQRRITHDPGTQVYGVIFEHLLGTVTVYHLYVIDLLHKC